MEFFKVRKNICRKKHNTEKIRPFFRCKNDYAESIERCRGRMTPMAKEKVLVAGSLVLDIVAAVDDGADTRMLFAEGKQTELK